MSQAATSTRPRTRAKLHVAAANIRSLTTRDAVRSGRLLPGGVGADRRAEEDGAGVDRDDAGGDRHAEAVHLTGRRAAALLPDLVVLAAVARALEPLGREALRHAAAEVGALLVQRVDARLLPVEHGRGVDLLGLRQ